MVRHPSVPLPFRRFLPLAFAHAAGCSSSVIDPGGGPVCTSIAVAGINLSVVDSVTGGPVPTSGLWARAVDGTYRDSSAMAFTNPQTGAVSLALAYERAGTYLVTVHAAGYQDWNKTGVSVTRDICHVVGVPVTARLVSGW